MTFAVNETRTRELINPATGERVIIGGTTTDIVIGPNGERAIVAREARARSNDQRTINENTEVFGCGCGCSSLPLLVRESITLCDFCKIPVAITHAKTWDNGHMRVAVCPACWEPGHGLRAITRFFRWLLQP